MEIREAILGRKSIRGFKDKAVPREIIEDILQTAIRAVSANNTQPWEFAVITGDVLKKIGEENVRAFVAGEAEDYEDTEFAGVYRQRLVGVAKQLFAAMDIAREDKEKRFWWMQRGFRFFDAPCAVIMYMDDSLKKACERYLEAVKNDTKDDSVTEALIAELKRHLDTEPAIKVVGDITDNRDELRELYENRAYL